MLASYFLDGSATRNFDAFLRIWDCSFAVVLPLDRYQFGCWKLWHRWDNGSAPDGSTESHLGSTSRQKTCSYFDLCEGPKKISKKRTFVQKAHFPKRRLMIYDDLLIHFCQKLTVDACNRWIPCTTQVVFKMRILMPSATGIWENLLFCMGRWVEKNIGIQWRKRYLWLRKNNISIHFMHAILSGFEI